MDEVRKNEIIAVILFAISLFLFLSIFSFKHQDISFYTSAPNLSSRNAAGIVGAYVGTFLVFFIGKAAYVIPLLFLIWGISRLFQLEERKTALKLFGAAVLVASVSASLSMIAGLDDVYMFEKGGLVGSIIANFLVKYLGNAGAAVFILAMILLSVLIATEFLILPILIIMFNFFWKMFFRIKVFTAEKTELFISYVQKKQEMRIAVRKETEEKLVRLKLEAHEARDAAILPVKKKVRFFEGVKPRVPEEKKEPSIVSFSHPEKAYVHPVREASISDSVAGDKTNYQLPALDLLRKSSKENIREQDENLKRKAAILEATLQEFGVDAKIVKINKGPVITLFELEPALGTKVNKITSLSDNISLAMKSVNIRILAPLPGKGTVGIEVPNEKSELVLFRDLIETKEYQQEKSLLKIALGKEIGGSPIVTDLAKMPHLLIAGTTGSGKTVCLNGIITSFLYNASPEEVRFLMIDPKRVELMVFEGLPHLVSPIVNSSKKAAVALNWVVNEMERRYEIFAGKGVRDITVYKNKRTREEPDLPYIVVVVDELADLMMVAQQDVEGAIMRIAQLSRAAGIHMILATQRPSVNVVTGVIKANFPARISFKVASKVDSRTVLDANGAEKLLGRGDMLLMEPGESSLIRGQCSLLEDSELKAIVKSIKSQRGGPQYIESAVESQEDDVNFRGMAQARDELFNEAVKMVLNTKQASVSMIQRRFRIGYNRAARIIDEMEDAGVVGSYNGSKPREILIDEYKAEKQDALRI